MQRTKKVSCWRCDGAGDVLDDDQRMRFCPTCMGMGTISTNATDQTSAVGDSWYEDPQPVRISDAD